MRRLFLLLFLLPLGLRAQGPSVPSQLEFGGLSLELTKDARAKVQTYVDNLRRNPKYFESIVEKARIHFPLIEAAFQAEGVPTDFKYLAVQESELTADAVSSSQAVGYWQFKGPTAQHIGMRVDGTVDERKNLYGSSLGAAKYLKENNGKLDNWIYALLSYNRGPSGVKEYVESKYVGAKRMTLDGDTHWYVFKFLAHKIAFETEIEKRAPSVLLGVEFVKGGSVEKLGKEKGIESDLMAQYNKWIKPSTTIPSDREYAVMLPGQAGPIVISNDGGEKPKGGGWKLFGKGKLQVEGPYGVAILIDLNGIKAIRADAGDTPASLANKGGIDVDQFLKFNDIGSYQAVEPGGLYYLKPKKNKAIANFHTVKPGETFWSISQQHGIKPEAIQSKNRMEGNEALESYRVLWLRRKRPKDMPIEFERPAPPDTLVVTPEPGIAPEPIAPTPDPTPKPEPRGKGDLHQVKPGETLYAISRMYGVQVSDLVDWNNLSETGVSVGQTLRVSPPHEPYRPEQELPTPTPIRKTYKVGPGETLYGISRKHDVTVQQLKDWNELEGTDLSIGQELFVEPQR